MGLEVTVLLVLLSLCSYMTEEREKQRGGGLEVKWEMDGRWETEVTGDSGGKENTEIWTYAVF